MMRPVLQLLAEGHSNREIAERLGIKPGTVESHVHHILKKLGVATRLQAALLASLVAFGMRVGTTQEKTGGAYDITWNVIASGGTNTGGAYTLNSTIGQSHTSGLTI